MLFPFSVFAQVEDFVKDGIKTARIRVDGADFGFPICQLSQVLRLDFDVLDDKYENLSYSIRHCNADFEPDDLSFNEFAEGFDERQIEDYQNSFNTHQSFTHYTLKIPNDDLRLLISGNYIVEVFEDSDRDNVVLRKKFMVYEDSDNSKISALVSKPFLLDYVFNYQQLKVSFLNDKLQISNPAKYLKVFAMQNTDFSSRKRLEISGFSHNTILYEKNSDENIFQGGSEFSFFDAKDVHFKALGIDDITFKSGIYNYKLTPFKPIEISYTYFEDLNGRYYIKNDKGFSLDLESDYVKVLFSLKYDPFADGEIYLYGELTDYLFNSDSKLEFNSQTYLWEKELLLKQGLYNFQFVEKNKTTNQTKYLSGSWFNTENDYLITVYTTLLKDRGDRLIMYKVVNSVK